MLWALLHRERELAKIGGMIEAAGTVRAGWCGWRVRRGLARRGCKRRQRAWRARPAWTLRARRLALEDQFAFGVSGEVMALSEGVTLSV